MVNDIIYLDNNATTPIDPLVFEAMIPYFTTKFGNASSKQHIYGKQASYAVENARELIANEINCIKEEIIFTSGATESINLAIAGVFHSYISKGNHIITVKTEHHAVLDTCKYLETQGARVDYLGVNEDGLIDMNELEEKISSETILVAIMLANNETGAIQDIEKISAITHQHHSLLLCDATQAIGKMKVDVNEYGLDLMPLSAHKFYGPKGIGGLYIRRKNPRVSIQALIHGGAQERNLRSGTLNVPGIVGLGKAMELINNKDERIRINHLRDKLENGLLETGLVKLNGSKDKRLINTSNVLFKNQDALKLMLDLHETLAVSTGSACSSENFEVSHVLKAMGLSDYEAKSAIRFSLGRFTTQEEINKALTIIKNYILH